MPSPRFLLAVALLGVCGRQYAAAVRPAVDVTCCPTHKTYLKTLRTPTALISYPGSGNTWVRHIIETLTGYHTTSVYCDKTLVPVFKAECDMPWKYNQSIVVKTHRLRYCYLWEKAVVVVRHPLHSIRGEYQRINTRSHTGFVDAEDWDWSDWYHVSTKMCRDWTDMFAAVFGTAEKPGCAQLPNYNMKVFFYEDLKTSSGALNPFFLDELLSYFGIDKADSFYDCAVRNHKGSYARQLPVDHPAAMLLNDTVTLQNFDQAGCIAAYNAYKSRFLHLQQPVEMESI